MCDSGGTGWLMSVDFSNGREPTNAVFDRSGDHVVDATDLITIGGTDHAPVGKRFNEGLPSASTFLGNRRYTPGTETSTGADVERDEVEGLGGPGTGRLSWEELKPN